MKYGKLAAAVIALVLSTSVNAVVVNTLNGTTYEWLEVTATQFQSRDQIEAMFEVDPIPDTVNHHL